MTETTEKYIRRIPTGGTQSTTETVTGANDLLQRTMPDCTYCGCSVEAHDPVFVYEERKDRDEDDERDDGENERVPAGQFCNYACLSAHIGESNLADGAICRLDA